MCDGQRLVIGRAGAAAGGQRRLRRQRGGAHLAAGGRLQRLEQEGGRGRLVARLARDPNQFLSTIQIGITLAGFLASAAAAVTLADPLVPLRGFLGGAAEPAARSSW